MDGTNISLDVELKEVEGNFIYIYIYLLYFYSASGWELNMFYCYC